MRLSIVGLLILLLLAPGLRSQERLNPPTNGSQGTTREQLPAILVQPSPDSVVQSDNRKQTPIDVRLRFAWGGGAGRRWSGKIRVDKGQFSGLRVLSLDADAIGSIVAYQQSISIVPRSAHTYDGCSVRLQAQEDAVLTIELTPIGVPHSVKRLTVPVASLVRGSFSQPLDEAGNKLQIRRSPGDALRIKLDRSHLVYRPGEAVRLTVFPHQLPVDVDDGVRCDIRLVAARSRKEIASIQERLEFDERGKPKPIGPVEFDTPELDGAYDIIVSLRRKKLNPLSRGKPLYERKVQFVVLSAQMQVAEPASWEELLAIDHQDPAWWKRLVKLPQWSWLTGFSNGPIDNGKVRKQQRENGSHIVMDVDGWQAFPLAVGKPGQPHLLEIEYPSNEPQTLGISILEPNAAGQVVPLGLDSGVTLDDSVRSRKPEISRHRIVFWPSTKTPFVLLTNRSQRHPSVVGKIRVLAGPPRLRDRPLPPAGLETRQLLAFYDKPLFPENFGASEALDSETSSSFRDWRTFYEGGDRLVQYLRNVGFSGAIVSVATDGSTIYPSKHLTPTPHFDNGVFFSSGQDVVQKDILEMLFRMFDRAGLTLVPAIQFSSPLEEIERTLRQPGKASDGLELVDFRGRLWLRMNHPQKGLAPYYNPLHGNVQKAMRSVVSELAQRYGHHRSFGGVSLQLGGNTYSQLPGFDWGYDDHTIKQFELARKKVPGKNRAEIIQQLRTTLKKEWLAWRSERLGRMFVDMQRAISSENAEAKLYLVGADTVVGEEANNLLQPRADGGSSIKDFFLRTGIDTDRLRTVPNIVLFRPQRHAPVGSLHEQAVNLAMQATPEVDDAFRHRSGNGFLHYHEPQHLALPSFDERSPFGQEKTQTWLSSTIVPDGDLNRKRFVHSIASMDCERIVDGGWMLPLGQEEQVRDLFESFRLLPAEPFETVSIKGGSTQPVVVRTLQRNGRTYAYVVNDAPWPVRVKLSFALPANCQLVPLTPRRLPPLQRKGINTDWSISLRPYDMVSIVLTSPQVRVSDVQVDFDQAIPSELKRRLFAFRDQIFSLGRKEPAPLGVTPNPSFELGVPGRPPVAWNFMRGAQDAVTIDEAAAHNGKRSLHLKSDGKRGVVWVRGKPFEPPTTGRLAISVWVRFPDPKKVPDLRIALDGVHKGKSYYRWQFARPQGNGARAKDGWGWYLLPIDNLPAKGLSQLRVGFDLMGAGEVWIDDVQVFDLWFTQKMEASLLQQFAVQARQLQQFDRFSDTQKFLDGYWPKFVSDYLSADGNRMARRPKRPNSPAAPPGAAEPQLPNQRNSRFRFRWPKFF